MRVEPVNDRYAKMDGAAWESSSAHEGRVTQPCRGLEERYRKLNRISEGTYGLVYRAQDKVSNEVVAVKQLKKTHVKDYGFNIQYLREVSLLAELRECEGVVRLREVCVETSRDDRSGKRPPGGYAICIVTDYHNHELQNLLNHHTFNIFEIRNLILQLLNAVAYMHGKWICHRDIKTSNLLYSNRGGVLKLCDFGLARHFGEPVMWDEEENEEYDQDEQLSQHNDSAVENSQDTVEEDVNSDDTLEDADDDAEKHEGTTKRRRVPSGFVSAGFLDGSSSSAQGVPGSEEGTKKKKTERLQKIKEHNVRYTTPVCTLWYRSFELLIGAKCYDPRPVDVWGVGCVLGELIMGEPMLQAETEEEQLYNVLSIDNPALAEWNIPKWRRLREVQVEPYFRTEYHDESFAQSSCTSNEDHTGSDEKEKRRFKRLKPAPPWPPMKMLGAKVGLLPKSVGWAMKLFHRTYRDQKGERSTPRKRALVRPLNKRDAPDSSDLMMLDAIQSSVNAPERLTNTIRAGGGKKKVGEFLQNVQHTFSTSRDHEKSLQDLVAFMKKICALHPGDRPSAEILRGDRQFFGDGSGLFVCGAGMMPTFPDSNVENRIVDHAGSRAQQFGISEKMGRLREVQGKAAKNVMGTGASGKAGPSSRGWAGLLGREDGSQR